MCKHIYMYGAVKTMVRFEPASISSNKSLVSLQPFNSSAIGKVRLLTLK